MHLFVEKGLRGDVATITKRYAKANNTYIDDYDDNMPSNHVIYLDANNLYGRAMSQSLPTHDFEWMSKDEIETLDVADNGQNGYILEVDMEYPKELHDLQNDYPLAPLMFMQTWQRTKHYLTSVGI